MVICESKLTVLYGTSNVNQDRELHLPYKYSASYTGIQRDLASFLAGPLLILIFQFLSYSGHQSFLQRLHNLGREGFYVFRVATVQVHTLGAMHYVREGI